METLAAGRTLLEEAGILAPTPPTTIAIPGQSPPLSGKDFAAVVKRTCVPDGARHFDVVRGSCVTDAMGASLASAMEGAALQPTSRDAEVSALGDHFLGASCFATQGQESTAASLEISRWKMKRTLGRLANAIVTADRHSGCDLVKSLAKVGTHPVHRAFFVEFASYDETPLPVQLRNDTLGLVAAQHLQDECGRPSAGRDVVVAQGLQLCSFSRVSTLRISTRAAPQKVVQHRNASGMLLRLECGEGERDRFVILLTDAVTPLSIVERMGTLHVPTVGGVCGLVCGRWWGQVVWAVSVSPRSVPPRSACERRCSMLRRSVGSQISSSRISGRSAQMQPQATLLARGRWRWTVVCSGTHCTHCVMYTAPADVTGKRLPSWKIT